MYLAFHKLSCKPFQISTDPRFLWCGEKHGEALANLRYGVLDHNGYVVLTGDAGTGKTTLINALIDGLDDRVLIARVSHPNLGVEEFLLFIAKKFDPTLTSDNKCDLLLFFEAFLNKAHNEGREVLLIIDEAHRLSAELLEELRLLSNIETAGQRLMTLFLVGQNELNPLLMDSRNHALRQRITLFYDLQPLAREETGRYIAHRLKVAGTELRLFSAAAVARVHQFSKGYPRLINILCDRALLTSYVENRKQVDVDIVLECAREMNLSGDAGAVDKPPEHVEARHEGEVRSSLPKRWSTALAAKRRAWTQKIAFRFSGSGTEKETGFRRRLNRLKERSAGRTSHLFRTYSPAVIPAVLASVFAAILITAAMEPDTNAQANKRTPAKVQRAAATTPNPQKPAVKNEHQPPDPPVAAETIHRPAPPPGKNPGPSSPGIVPPSLPGNVELAESAMARNDYQTVIDLLGSDSGSVAGRPARANMLYAKALTAQSKRLLPTEPAQALNMVKQAVAADPENAEAFFIMGNLYRQNKDYSHAVEAYRSAVKIKPDFSDAFFNLGFIYATTGLYQAAEKVFIQVVQLKPVYLGKALFNLAVVQQKLGKPGESLQNLEQAAALQPENPKVQAYLNQLKEAR